VIKNKKIKKMNLKIKELLKMMKKQPKTLI